MSDVRNKANSLNVSFPIPGVNNASQGFRDNTNAAQQALFQASDEITKIQNTRLKFSGDAVGQSDRIANAVVVGAADPALEIAFTLGDTIGTGVSYSTNNGDFSLTFDGKGRLIGHSVVQHLIGWAGGHGKDVTVPIVGESMGTGTGSISFPTFKFDGSGRLTGTTTQVINYGLQNQKMTYGSLLIGGSTSFSRELVAPSANGVFALVANGPELSWQPVGAGTVSGVIGGTGIKVTGDAAAPTVNLDLSQLISEPGIDDVDELVYQDATDNTAKRLTLGQLRNKVVKVIADPSPQLGGALDVRDFHLMTTGNQGVAIYSAQAAAKSVLTVAEAGITASGPAGSIGITTTGVSATSGASTLVMTTTGVTTSTGLTSQTLTATGVKTTNGSSVLELTSTGITSTAGSTSLVLVTGSGTLTNGANSLSVAAQGITVQSAANTSLTLVGTSLALQAPSLTLNGQTFPTAAGPVGQFLSQGPNNTLIWSAPQAFFQTIPDTLFVGQGGNDTTGNGALNAPYLTIAKALSVVPNNDAKTYTIMLLGGTYTENLDIQNKRNLAIEGFFGSTNSVIRGNIQVMFNVNSLLMSKITIDTSNQDLNNGQPTFAVLGGLGEGAFKDCNFLRGPNAKSDLTAISLNGQLGSDITFTNCTIQGKIDNATIADGSRVVFQNCGLPDSGWTGLKVKPDSNTFISGAPLMKGIEHNGGILVMENIGAIMPENYQVNVNNPALPKWENGRPKFVTTTGAEAFEDDAGVTLINTQDDEGNNVEVLLLDPQGNPIDDVNNPGESLKTTHEQFKVDQDDTITNYTVGLYSIANADTGETENKLELTNVNFYYQGAFSKLYKEGDCQWSFTRVKRRSDQDFITGPRLAYDVQPDEGNFMAHYTASGILLRYEDDNSVVPDGVIDPKSGNTFMVTLTNNATLKLKTPEATAYAPGPKTTSGELYSEVLVAVRQDANGNRQVGFSTTFGAITWISNTAPNVVPGGLTFYLFRYFSRTRTWVGQKQVDASGMKVTPVTSSSYTLQATDAGSYIRRSNTSANQVVVPNNTSVQFNIGVQIQVTQIGTGQTEIVPGNSVIINTPDGRFLRKRFSNVVLTKVAANTWDLTGDLDPNQTSVVTTTVDNNQINVSSNTAKTDGKIN